MAEYTGPTSPKVTVVLPIKNGERWIQGCLSSLLNQTYRDFEVLLVDDGCTDSTMAIAASMPSDLIRVIKGPQQGLARALALGVEAARGEYIARQDVDDLSEPMRLGTQVEFLDRFPECVAVGTWATEIDQRGETTGEIRMPISNRAVQIRSLLYSPLIHPSVMMRRSAVIEAGNYRSPSCEPYAEDYDLWSRLLRQGEIRNLARPLIRYRRSPTSLTGTHAIEIADSAARIAASNLAKRLGYDSPSEAITSLTRGYYRPVRRVPIHQAVHFTLLVLRARLKFGLSLARDSLPVTTYFAPVTWMRP